MWNKGEKRKKQRFCHGPTAVPLSQTHNQVFNLLIDSWSTAFNFLL